MFRLDMKECRIGEENWGVCCPTCVGEILCNWQKNEERKTFKEVMNELNQIYNHMNLRQSNPPVAILAGGVEPT